MNLKTIGFKTMYKKHDFDGLMLAIQVDEEGSRSKERVFSQCGKNAEWDYTNQAPELWDQYNTDFKDSEHVRIHHSFKLDRIRYMEIH